ncbi:LysR family transcriptional regulator substrate-binding protein [Niallia nealsonii]|uniref:LysR family transcriptional regulator substrate-binding protein n=1 Tax=Niallia nealsonii TaxID=115979 RepID=UPI001F171934|nr:LysR family transcriptional regulator substrate-binding protein [Niallia nealsonii]
MPYITKICNSHRELQEKIKEMEGLYSGLIRIGTFTSVSCHWLPGLIRDFKEQYPTVHVELHQGDYTDIANWIKEGSVDFGFVNPKAVSNLTTVPLQEDEMLAVLPVNHTLSASSKVSLKELTHGPYILLDEGEISEPLTIFKQNNFEPNYNTDYMMIPPLCPWWNKGSAFLFYQNLS